MPVSGNLSANTSTLLLKSTLLGGGISLQPIYSVSTLIARGDLVPLLTGYEPRQLGIYGVYTTRKQMTPLRRSCLDFLMEQMAADPRWHSG